MKAIHRKHLTFRLNCDIIESKIKHKGEMYIFQKNKFIREDIKAVCSSAAKKLVALGLAVAVGGACTIGGSCNRVVRAQTHAETNSETQPNANETQRRIDNLMQVRRERRIARCSRFWTAARLDGQEALERRQIAENPDHLNQLEDDEILYWGASPTIFGYDAEIRHHYIDLIRNLERQLENEQARRRTASECNEDLNRNVTVNQANLLTVAPGVPMRTQDGTTFRIGATAQETLENLQRAMGLTTPSSNLFVRFVCALISLFTFTLFGRWFGGSK